MKRPTWKGLAKKKGTDGRVHKNGRFLPLDLRAQIVAKIP